MMKMEENQSESIPSPIPPVVDTETPPVSRFPRPPFGSWWKVSGLVLGAVILAGGIFFAGYQYAKKQTPPIAQPTPTPIAVTTPISDETANWKTYTNTKYGYFLKYPQGWIVEEGTDSVSWKSADYKSSVSGNIISGQNIVLFVDQNPTRKSLENWWGTTNTDYTITNKINFKIDGRDSIKYDLSAPGGAVYGALLSNSDKVFRIEAYSIADKTSNTIDVFNQILSTFQFTD